MSDELKPCPHCGWHRSSIISKTETRVSDSGLEITESVFSPFTGDYHEERIPACDFRHGFYARCNKCGSRGPVAWTPWHVRTEDECDDWCRDHKYWGFDIDSEFSAPAIEEAAAAWNSRAAVTDEQFAVAVHDGEAWQKVRTCSIDGVRGGGNCGTTTYRLSCGHNAVMSEGVRFGYCPSCGAKVVG